MNNPYKSSEEEGDGKKYRGDPSLDAGIATLCALLLGLVVGFLFGFFVGSLVWN